MLMLWDIAATDCERSPPRLMLWLMVGGGILVL